MCGIAGYIDAYSGVNQQVIEQMTRIMQHRGPDGEGYYLDDGIALGHRRLSIIDLEGGKQPMSDDTQQYWITFNGEIYNFPQLREQLRALGHSFQTRCDTETILAAYKQYGDNCVDYLRGMFAFAIWDTDKRRLFVARDRVGKKPLYFSADHKRFIFASEIKALLQHPHVSREVDAEAIADYFTYNYIPFPRTIFKSIKKLPPGHVLVATFDRHGELLISQKRYWDLHYAPDYSLTEDDWSEALRNKIAEATRIRMISDVPLGAFLSGGVDSSAVVAYMAQSQSAPVKTFSIGFKEEDFSETHYARQVAKQFGTDHHEFIVEPDAMAILPELAWQFDEPFADSSAVPTYYVSKLAREHVTVILSGDGGDETFAGYGYYGWATDVHKYDKLPQWLKTALFSIPSALMPDGLRGKGLLRHLGRSSFERFAGMNNPGEQSYFKKLFSDDLVTKLTYIPQNYPNYDLMHNFYNQCNSDDYLTKVQYVDTKVYLAEDIMTKVDRASMLCSLETRAPLLDHELLELAARIPSSLKIKDGVTKYILKKALEPVLPHDILYRKKMGFGVPLVHWFKGDLVDYAHDILLSKNARERGFFNSAYVDDVLEKHKRRGRDLSSQIWALLFFEHWCQQWL